MHKLLFLSHILALVNAAAMYRCSFGPDAANNYDEQVVKSSIAHNCGEFCECVGLSDSTCYFGPDQKGNFIKEVGVSSEMADGCDREWCICDTHDFEEGETFEQLFEKRAAAAVDRTDPVQPDKPVDGGSALIQDDVQPSPVVNIP